MPLKGTAPRRWRESYAPEGYSPPQMEGELRPCSVQPPPPPPQVEESYAPAVCSPPRWRQSYAPAGLCLFPCVCVRVGNFIFTLLYFLCIFGSSARSVLLSAVHDGGA